MTNCPDLETYLENFSGVTDLDYLKFHYQRFCTTKVFVFESDLPKPQRVLDIGAHWLHQALLYALEGISVTAADLPGTLEDPTVQRIAADYGITLYTYKDLSCAGVFDSLPENTFDLVLFSEILEHISFNPVDMWKAIYRVMRPSGRIVLTTPNYYYIKGKAWDFKRFMMRMGEGISVHEILSKFTNGPHWKEYSSREICNYFTLLSPDFHIQRMCYESIPYFPAITLFEKFCKTAERHIPILRNNIFAEIALPSKEYGITIQPGW